MAIEKEPRSHEKTVLSELQGRGRNCEMKWLGNLDFRDGGG